MRRSSKRAALAIPLTVIPILTDILLPGIGVADNFLIIVALLLLLLEWRERRRKKRRK